MSMRLSFMSTRLPLSGFALLAALIIHAPATAADSWPEWRGDGQGHSGARDVPAKWSEDAVGWRTEIPGLGWSTPVIADGKVWLTTATDTRASKEEAARRKQLTTNSQPLIFSSHVSYRALCLELSSGKTLKDIEVMSQKDPQFIQIDNSYATPSPIFEDVTASSAIAAVGHPLPLVTWRKGFVGFRSVLAAGLTGRSRLSDSLERRTAACEIRWFTWSCPAVTEILFACAPAGSSTASTAATAATPSAAPQASVIAILRAPCAMSAPQLVVAWRR